MHVYSGACVIWWKLTFRTFEMWIAGFEYGLHSSFQPLIPEIRTSQLFHNVEETFWHEITSYSLVTTINLYPVVAQKSTPVLLHWFFKSRLQFYSLAFMILQIHPVLKISAS